jgi:hypothetical protein
MTLLMVKWSLFIDMWAHRSWSCSSISIMHAHSIITINFGETSHRCLTHRDWKGDLLVNHLHTRYSI